MLRSLMTGVTGIRAHQTMLDVVGNNVANVNTTGFKKSMTVFQDLLYQTTRGATSPGDNRGGVNAMQVGLGVQVAGIEMVYSAGPLQYTGNRTDMAISGDGMFVFADGESRVYSRAGNFTQDANGKLVHVGTGYKVQGFKMTQDPLNPLNYIRSSQLSDIEIKVGSKMEARATSTVGFRCNLDSRVNTYLPMGAKAVDATIKMGGEDYKVDTIMGKDLNKVKGEALPHGFAGFVVPQMSPTLSAISTPVAPNPPINISENFTVVAKQNATLTNYVEYTFSDSATPTPTALALKFDITDVIGGKPVLSLQGYTPPTPIPGPVIRAQTIGGVTYPLVTTELKYNSATGVLDVIDPTTNNPIWSTNVLANLNSSFMSFSLDNNGTKVNVVAEYDTATSQMTFWWSDGTGANTGKVVKTVPMNSDGTLNIPTFGLDISDSTGWPGGATGIWAAAGSMKLTPTPSGLGFEIQAADVPGTTNLKSAYIHSMAAAGSEFLTYQFTDTAGNPQSVVLNLLDVKNGSPVLGLGTNTIKFTKPPVPPSTTPIDVEYKVSYNDATGALQVKDNLGATVWETNVRSGMNYSSFKIKDAGANLTYEAIVEFNSQEVGGSPVPVTFWMSNGQTPPSLSKVKVMVPIKKDGTFDIPEGGLDIGVLDPSDPYPASSGFPPPWYGGTGRIFATPAAKGYGFEILATNGQGTMQTATGLVQQDMTAVHSTKIDVYDCQGGTHTLEVQYKKIGDNLWRWEAYFPSEPELFPVPPSGVLEFGPCGKLISKPFEELDIPFSLVGAQNEKITLDFSGQSFGYDVDELEGITQYGSATTTTPYYQDGYTMGILSDFSTGKDGTISGIYSNGKNIPMYRIAIATFQNVNGLERIGDTMFRESTNSGMAQIGVPMEGGAGSINGGNLEMSNVDISEEFTRLILAQRGFQANARVVTTSDGILEEVVNLKR